MFDQYSQDENKLTHALVVTLDRDRDFLREFMAALGVELPTIGRRRIGREQLRILEQTVPHPGSTDASPAQGAAQSEIIEGSAKFDTLPDGVLFLEPTDDFHGWCLIIESKAGTPLTERQMNGHVRALRRVGFSEDWIRGLAITADDSEAVIADRAGWLHTSWRALYALGQQYIAMGCGTAGARASRTFWVEQFCGFLEVMEEKKFAKQNTGRGMVLTTFSGVLFPTGYTDREAIRLVRQVSDRLARLGDGVLPGVPGTVASARKKIDSPWDAYVIHGPTESGLTQRPHYTISFNPEALHLTLTIPDKLDWPRKQKKLFRERFAGPDGLERFRAALHEVLANLGSCFAPHQGWQPTCWVLHRRWPAGNSGRKVVVSDGVLSFDLRAGFPPDDPAQFQLLVNPKSGRREYAVQHQPLYVEMMRDILTGAGNGNHQFQVGGRFFLDRDSGFQMLKRPDAVEKVVVPAFQSFRPLLQEVLAG